MKRGSGYEILRPEYIWLEICKATRRALSRQGWRFQKGVEQAATRAALDQIEHGCEYEACATVVMEKFRAMRVNPQPDSE